MIKSLTAVFAGLLLSLPAYAGHTNTVLKTDVFDGRE